MSYARVRARLAEWYLQILGELRDGADAERVALKGELEEASRCLELCDRVGIDGAAQVHVLPFLEGRGGYSEYRILVDAETEDREHWLEPSINGEPVRLHPGDLVVEKGPARRKRRAT